MLIFGLFKRKKIEKLRNTSYGLGALILVLGICFCGNAGFRYNIVTYDSMPSSPIYFEHMLKLNAIWFLSGATALVTIAAGLILEILNQSTQTTHVTRPESSKNQLDD